MAQDPPWTKNGKNRTKIHNLDIQFPQRLKSTFLRFFHFFIHSLLTPCGLFLQAKDKLPNWIYFQILIHYGHSSSTEPSTFLILSKGSLNIISKCSVYCMVSQDHGIIQHLPNFKGQIEGQRNKNLGSASSMSFVTNWSQSKYWVSRYDPLSLGGFICIQKLVNFQFIHLIFCKVRRTIR